MKRPISSGFTVVLIMILGVLILYQLLITIILPFRFNIFILFLQISFLFFLIFRIIWPN